MVMASCAAVFLPAPRVMAKDEKLMKLNPMETKFVQEAATVGMAEVRIVELAEKKAEAKDTGVYAMMAAKDQPPSLPVTAPANDATCEKQIPFRLKYKCAHLTDDDLPVVEGEHVELVGRPQKKLPVGQTKGSLYVS